MAGKPSKVLRCAIYTRKSTEHGLELEFNSLDAQREACEAYIKSQAAEGWQGSPKRYDDPAYSGGSLERPAVQRLLKDIQAGLIDVVVVYKIDRLTRSLADFAKLVEIFDAKSVSFVAVTQQFNTTTSMGRLTLNVLLSFAQFERELASERVRDKVAASRRKGKWTGGSVPLGYASKDKRLVVNPAEAKIVRFIFARYIALKSFQKLVEELDRKGIVTKRREIAGRTVGGIPFTYGPLAYLLKNRTYLGETGHDGAWFAGEHEPIIDRATFEKVQDLLKAKKAGHSWRRQQTGALLTGILFDDRGNRMSPGFSVKNDIRYPFYVSSALLRGRKAEAGTVARLPAQEIESAILLAVRDRIGTAGENSDLTPSQLIDRFLERVVVRTDRITLILKPDSATMDVPWTPTAKRNLARIEADAEDSGKAGRAAPNPQLIQALVHAHAWLKSLSDGTYASIEELATAARLHPKVVRSRIRLAFLAPDIVRTMLDGTQKTKMKLGDLTKAVSLAWNEQRCCLNA